MEIVIKIVLSIFCVGLIGAMAAFAVAAPSNHGKFVEFLQHAAYYFVNAAVLYFIWTW